jgi:hypothetical protein
VLGLVLSVFCWVFADAIFRDRNFCYRDAGQFYYPLLKLVQDEWESGRWPLWNPYENGGMPLLGNPASAVLYPPRIVVFQWLPISYASAHKWYTLLHVLFSAATAYAMARNWRASEFAAGFAALSYSFGAAVMFQYCNVIFLVGAAWVPLGLLAADRMLRAGSWRWGATLGLVLAMQVLGGDPEAAYITGGLAALYLILLDLQFGLALNVALGTILLLKFLLGRESIKSLDGVVLALIAVAQLVAAPVAWWWLGQKQSTAPHSADALQIRRLRRLSLSVAAAVAVSVSAVQWIPAWEFSRITLRAAGGMHHEPYAFWIAPWRAIELFWPNVSGHQFPINTRWIDIIVSGDRVWVPSLYFGTLALILSLAAWRVRVVPTWQRLMSITLVLSLWAAMGPAGGVSWYWKIANRAGEIVENGHLIKLVESAEETARDRNGPPTELDTPGGGLYWLMVHLLPGFGTFRYPAKLMTFAAVAFSALAAVGWDRLFSTDICLRRPVVFVALVSLAVAVVAMLARPFLADWLGDSWIAHGTPTYGPLQAGDASWCIVRAIATTAVTLGLAAGACKFLPLRLNADSTAAIVLLIVAVDLGLANRWLVSTSAQEDFDAMPKVTKIIEAAEAAEPSTEPRQPFRVHRISIWSPRLWFDRVSPVQDEEVFRWERDTIQPKYGMLPHAGSSRISYTINEGTLEPYDYWWFFAPFYSNVTEKPRSVVYYPMRGFDMWGSKYFVLPHAVDPKDQHRGIATFLLHSELIEESEWTEDDFQVRRNGFALPRAWVVHQLVYRTPIHGLRKEDRTDRMVEILYPGFDGLWLERAHEGKVMNPREVAWIEHPDPAFVTSLQDPTADPVADRCRIVRYDPDRVEIDVETAARGVMVLADLFFAGWELTVDGKPTEILRVNRMMRGVPLSPGQHRVEFAYKPLSFRVGACITLVGLAAIACAFAQSWWYSRRLPRQSNSSATLRFASNGAAD